MAADDPCSRLDELHEFWFAGNDGWFGEAEGKRWFMGGEELDAQVSERFAGLAADAAAGALDGCASNDRHLAALVVALDQLPRNLHRGKPEAFAADGKAIALARKSAGSGRLEGLWPAERLFVLMPYQHSEDLEVQDEGVRLFLEFSGQAPAEHAEFAAGTHKYAVIHRDIIARFGRFPHRNAALGREPTEEETRWLAEGGETFGQ